MRQRLPRHSHEAGLRETNGRVGIANDTTVVFYGDNSNWFACYAFWQMKLYGHADARIMNGGRKLWLAQNRALTRDVPQYPTTDYLPAKRTLRFAHSVTT